MQTTPLQAVLHFSYLICCFKTRSRANLLPACENCVAFVVACCCLVVVGGGGCCCCCCCEQTVVKFVSTLLKSEKENGPRHFCEHPETACSHAPQTSPLAHPLRAFPFCLPRPPAPPPCFVALRPQRCRPQFELMRTRQQTSRGAAALILPLNLAFPDPSPLTLTR